MILKRILKLCFLVSLIFIIIIMITVNNKITNLTDSPNKNYKYIGFEFTQDDNFGTSIITEDSEKITSKTNDSDDSKLNLTSIIQTLIWTSFSKNETVKINEVISDRNFSDRNFTAKSTTQIKRPFTDCLNSTNRVSPSSYRIMPKNCTNTVDLIFLIKSSIYRNSLRNTIRSTWGREVFGDELDSAKIKSVRRIFLLGSDEDKENIPLLKRENEMFQDILQGSFPDTYASVTHKVLMGLKFISDFCETRFVAVVDDDTVVSPWNLFHLLPSGPVDEFYSGFIKIGVGPIRDPKNRWYISTEEYSCPFYPAYALGTLFVLSYNTTLTFSTASQNYQYFSIDDVFIGGLAEDIGVPKTYYPFNYYSECGFLLGMHSSAKSRKQLVVCHGAEFKNEHQILWSEFCYTASQKNISKQILYYCQPVLN